MNHDPVIRIAAEKSIAELAEIDFQNYLEKLALVLIGEGFSLSLRKLSATLIKNPISNVAYFTEKWKNLNVVVKDNLKQQILSALGSENAELRKMTASVISSLVKIELPITSNWPVLLPILCKNDFENKIFHNAAVETLGFICEELKQKDVMPNEIDQIMSAIIICLKDNQNDFQLVTSSMKALIRALPLIGLQKMQIAQYSDIVMNQIINTGNNYQSNEVMLEYVCRAFLELAENYYDTVELYLEQISSFTFLMISSGIQRLRLMGLEFWCRLGNEELERCKNKLRSKSYYSKYYLQKHFSKLFQIIETLIQPETDNESEDEWTESKASIYILIILVQVVEIGSFEILVSYIKSRNLFNIFLDNINSQDENILKKCLIILSCLFETSHKVEIFQVALQYLFKLLLMLNSANQVGLKIVISRVFVSMFKVISIFLESENLKNIIGTFKNHIFCNNNVGINICKSLNQIISRLGDENTSKSQSKLFFYLFFIDNLSPHFEGLIAVLTKCDESQEFFNTDNNLALHCFSTIEHLICYSSHDKQGKLTEILVHYVVKLKDLNTRGYQERIVLQLEAQYTHLMRVIIVKLINPLKMEDAKSIYDIIVETFKRKVYDEGLLAVSALALSKIIKVIYIFKT